MPIVQSVILAVTDQIGGRYITERHTDSAGKIYNVEYFARAGVEVDIVLANRAAALNEWLSSDELYATVFDNSWDHALVHATTNELVAYVRTLYRESSKERLALISRRILEWITNGRFTDTQVRTSFGLQAAQWTTLKNKMQTLVANYAALEAAVGE